MPEPVKDNPIYRGSADLFKKAHKDWRKGNKEWAKVTCDCGHGYYCDAHGLWVPGDAVRRKDSPRREKQSPETCHTCMACKDGGNLEHICGRRLQEMSPSSDSKSHRKGESSKKLKDVPVRRHSDRPERSRGAITSTEVDREDEDLSLYLQPQPEHRTTSHQQHQKHQKHRPRAKEGGDGLTRVDRTEGPKNQPSSPTLLPEGSYKEGNVEDRHPWSSDDIYDPYGDQPEHWRQQDPYYYPSTSTVDSQYGYEGAYDPGSLSLQDTPFGHSSPRQPQRNVQDDRDTTHELGMSDEYGQYYPFYDQPPPLAPISGGWLDPNDPRSMPDDSRQSQSQSHGQSTEGSSSKSRREGKGKTPLSSKSNGNSKDTTISKGKGKDTVRKR